MAAGKALPLPAKVRPDPELDHGDAADGRGRRVHRPGEGGPLVPDPEGEPRVRTCVASHQQVGVIHQAEATKVGREAQPPSCKPRKKITGSL